ncbi:hypothetical protein TGFOU_285770B [Toxoplasma gondii FOU]|uniref:Uncharacterized protein n=1 Tax=Toxoplasma gondii FOU TaxID=943167 RepID=A0A086LDK8_TOXGO|nr:hypothetical protein TGFOU_285770B [Toxoplasma gondii FOU]
MRCYSFLSGRSVSKSRRGEMRRSCAEQRERASVGEESVLSEPVLESVEKRKCSEREKLNGKKTSCSDTNCCTEFALEKRNLCLPAVASDPIRPSDFGNVNADFKREEPNAEHPLSGLNSGKQTLDCRDVPAAVEANIHLVGLQKEASSHENLEETLGDRGKGTRSMETRRESDFQERNMEAKRVLQREILCDLFLNALLFCRDEAFSEAATSTFLGILKKVLQDSMLGKLSPVASAKAFKRLLLTYSIQRPPSSIKVFTSRALQAAMTYGVETFYRHYQLYAHCFTVRNYLVFQQETVPLPPRPRLSLQEFPVDAPEETGGEETDKDPRASAKMPSEIFGQTI